MKVFMTKRIRIIAIFAAAVLLVAATATFAWFLKNYTIGGANIETGTLGVIVTTYRYDGSAVTQVTRKDEPDGQDIDLTYDFQDALSKIDENNPATFFVKIEKENEGIDVGYKLSFILKGLTADGDLALGTTDPVDASIIYSGGFAYHIEDITRDVAGAADELTAMRGTIAPIEPINFDGLNNIMTRSYVGTLTDTENDNIDYYKITVSKPNPTAFVPEYTGRTLELYARVEAYQTHNYENGDEVVIEHNVYTATELIDALERYRPGDRINIKKDITLNRDLVFNRPVDLYIDHTLNVYGNVIYSFNSPEDCVLNTMGGGKLIVSKNGNSGGEFLINTPSSRFVLRGSNNLNHNRGDIYIQTRMEVAASYDLGLTIDGCRIYATDDTGKMPEGNEEFRTIYVNNGGSLIVTYGTEVGSIQAALSENVYYLSIINNGTIDRINLADMSQNNGSVPSDTEQIYVLNNGMINNATIVLPVWSKPFYKDPYRGNTYIEQDLAGSYITVNKLTSSDDSHFQDKHIVRRKPDHLVEVIENDPSNLLIYYYDVEDENGEIINHTLESILTEFFNKHIPGGEEEQYYTTVADALITIKNITVRTASDKYITSADYTYMRTLKNIESIDLSDSFTEYVKLDNLPVGGTSSAPKTINEITAHIPSGAFQNLTHLSELRLPSNAQTIGMDVAYNTSVKDLYMPASVYAFEVYQKTYNFNAFRSVTYVHIQNSAVIVDGLSSRVKDGSSNDHQTIFCVPENMVESYREYYNKDGEWHFTAINRYLKIVPASTLIFENLTKLNEDDEEVVIATNEYLVREVEDGGWEIVSYYSSTHHQPPVVGYGLTMDGSPITIVGVGEYGFYRDYYRTGSVEMVDKLEFVDSVRYIGDYAFAVSKDSGATSTNKNENYRVHNIDFNNIEEIGNYAFNWLLNGKELALDAATAPRLSSIGSYAFNYAGITRVDLANCVFIGNGAFNQNTSLTYVNLPVIPALAGGFNGCAAIIEVRAPECVSIGANTFDSKTNLIVGYFPKAEVLGTRAFYNTPKLRILVLGKPVNYGTEIITSTYARVILTAKLSQYEDGFEYVGNTGLGGNAVFLMSDKAYALYTENGKTPFSTRVETVPDALLDINNIVLDDGITSVAEVTALELTRENDPLERVYVPTSLDPAAVEADGYLLLGATARATDFEKTPIPHTLNEKPLVAISTLAFCNSVLKGKIVIPPTVKYIGRSAFYASTYDTAYTGEQGIVFEDSADDPAQLSYLGNYAFYQCKWLTEITLPDTLTQIGYATFYQCTNLIEIIAQGVEILGEDSETSNQSRNFYECSNLEYVDLRSLRRIEGQYAFQSCNKVRVFHLGPMEYSAAQPHNRGGSIRYAVIYHGNPSVAFSGTAFSQNKTTGVGFIQYDDNYSNLLGKAFADNLSALMRRDLSGNGNDMTAQDFHFVKLPNGNEWLFTASEQGLGLAYCYQETMTPAQIKEDVISLYQHISAAGYTGADKGFTSIVGQCFRNTIITEGTLDFSDVDMAELCRLEHIGRYAFYNTETSITQLTFPDSMLEIGYLAFSATKIRNITIKGDPKLGSALFKSCKYLDSVDISGVTEIACSELFYLSKSTVIKLDSLETISGPHNFRECAVVKIEAPKLTSIEYYWNFYNCDSLVEVIMPELVEIYGERNFGGCNYLSYIYMPKLTKLDMYYGTTNYDAYYTFSDCPNLRELHIGPLTKTARGGGFSTSAQHKYATNYTYNNSGAITFMHGTGATQTSGNFLAENMIGIVPYEAYSVMNTQFGNVGQSSNGCIRLPEGMTIDDVKRYGTYVHPTTGYESTKLFYYVEGEKITIVHCMVLKNYTSEELMADIMGIEAQVKEEMIKAGVSDPNPKVTALGPSSFRNTDFVDNTLILPDQITELGTAAFCTTELTKIIAPGVTTLGNLVFSYAYHLGEVRIGGAEVTTTVEGVTTTTIATLSKIGGVSNFYRSYGVLLYLEGNGQALGYNILNNAEHFAGGSVVMNTTAAGSYESKCDGRAIIIDDGGTLLTYGTTPYDTVEVPKYIYQVSGTVIKIMSMNADGESPSEFVNALTAIYAIERARESSVVDSITLGSNLFWKKAIAGPLDLSSLPIASIGANCFRETQLTEVILPETCKTLGGSSFYSVSTLRTFYGPGVTGTVSREVFSNCTALRILYLPNIQTVHAYLFFGMGSYIARIHIGGTTGGEDNWENGTRSPQVNGAVIMTVKGTTYPKLNEWLQEAKYRMLGIYPAGQTTGGYQFVVNLDEKYDTRNIQTFGTHHITDTDPLNVGKYLYVPSNDDPKKIQLLYCHKKSITAEELMADFAAFAEQGFEIVSIGKMAFRFTQITGDYITFPDTVKEIGEHAFNFAEGKNATRSSIKSIDLNNVEAVGAYAFANLDITESINLGSKLQTIGANAFSPYAASITIEATDAAQPVIAIAESSEAIFSNSATLYVNTVAYAAYQNGWANFTSDRIVSYGAIFSESGVTFQFVPDDAGDGLRLVNISFSSSLTNVVIPSAVDGKNVTQMNLTCFETLRDKGITTLTLPDHLEAGAFDEYDHRVFINTLEAFAVNASSVNYSVHEGVLYDKAETVLLVYPTSRRGTIYTVPSTVVDIPVRGVLGALYLAEIKR